MEELIGKLSPVNSLTGSIALLTQGIVTDQLYATENGIYNAPTGKAYDVVTVDVPKPSGEIQINQNGIFDVEDYERANVNVPPPILINKTITENGTYNASDDNADGYNNVIVDIPVVDPNATFRALLSRSITNEEIAAAFVGVRSIGQFGLAYCLNITDLVVPDSVLTIEQAGLAYMSNLTSLVIGNGVVSIGNEGCRGLGKVRIIDIGTSIQTIGNSAFYGTYQLQSLTIRATNPPTISATSLNNISANALIYVPAESVQAYKTANIWSQYADRIYAIS